MKLSETGKEVILKFAECDMKISSASRALYMHRNTVDYHLEIARRETGLNPKRFYDLVKLVGMCGEVTRIENILQRRRRTWH